MKWGAVAWALLLGLGWGWYVDPGGPALYRGSGSGSWHAQDGGRPPALHGALFPFRIAAPQTAPPPTRLPRTRRPAAPQNAPPQADTAAEVLRQQATAVTVDTLGDWIDAVLRALPAMGSGQDLAALFSACVEVAGLSKPLRGDPRLQQLLQALAAQAALPVVSHSPASVSDIAFAAAFFGVPEATAGPLLARLAADARAAAADFTAAQAARALWAWATLGQRDTELATALGQRLEVSRPVRSSLANAAWALATLDVRDEALLAGLARNLLLQPGGEVRHTAKMVWAFAKLNVRDAPLLTDLGDNLVRAKLQRDGTVAELTEVAWAYATLNVRHPPLLAALAGRARQPPILRAMDASHLIGLLWAFDRLEFLDPLLITAWGQMLSQRPGFLSQTTAPELAQSVQILRRLQVRDPRLWEAVSTQLSFSQALADFSGAEVCETFAAVALWDPEEPDPKHGDPQPLWPLLADRTLQLAADADLNSTQAAAVVCSLGLMQWPPAELRGMVLPLLDAVLARGLWQRLPGFQAREVLRALARLRILHPPALKALAACALRRKGNELPPLKSLSVAMWAFATVGLSPTPMMWTDVRNSVHGQDAWLTAPLADLAWAMAVAGCRDDEVVRQSLQWLATRPLREVDESKVHQLISYVLLNTPRFPQTTALLRHDLAAFREKCRRTFAAQGRAVHTSRHAQESWLQVSVAATLRALPWPVAEEALLPDAADYTADLRLVGRRVVLEVDGPTHFVLSPAGPAVNGATAFKRRLFLAAGYAVLPVTHVQWEALPTQPERERYLRDRLTPLVARAGRTD